MEHEHLHLFITEEIYRLPEDERSEQGIESPVAEISSMDVVSETPQTEGVKEPELKLEKEEVVTETETNEINEGETPAHIETVQESPEIPHHDLEPSKDLPFAVFHSSNNASDIELLHKIIDACKLPEDQYKIFGGGFDQSVHFKKALVFVPEAKAFYTPIPYKNSVFLCSKPLDQISGDVQEKAKLWAALQKFV